MPFLSARATQSPEAPALIFEGGQWTYAELDRQVNGLCAALRERGLVCGDRLGVSLENSPFFVALIHAALRLGLTLVPLNRRLSEAERAWQIRAAECKAVITQPFDFSPADDFPPCPADCPSATVFFTSGTSGQPKGALLTLAAHQAAARASSQRLETRAGERWLLCLPLYHIGGMSILFRACYDGLTVILQERFQPEETCRLLNQHSAALVSLVPTMLYRLMPLFERGLPPVLRLILLGGAAAAPELLQKAFALNLPVASTYGLTEACSQVSTALPQLVRRKPGCAGAPLSGVSVRIVDADGNSLSAGQVGEIAVSGPALMRGYLGQPPLTGEFRTGDIGHLDADGDLWVLTRRSDLIISGGENIYPEEVERALLAHPAVREACVFGLPDPEWGQSVAAAVVSGEPCDAAALIQFLRGKIAGYKVPKQILFVEALPYTASGKLKRAEVAQVFDLRGQIGDLPNVAQAFGLRVENP
ncbi:MAG: o-succinylbenzoate--CoA ligase [Anaerolineales bacterium]